MRHTTVVTLLVLAFGSAAGLTSCALPERSSSLRPTSRADRYRPAVPAATPAAVGTSPAHVEALRLEREGDDRALVAFLDGAMESVTTPVPRARLELMRARALVRLGRKLTALTAFGRAWQQVEPEVEGLGQEILVAWADHEMAVEEFRSAVGHYEMALRARRLGPVKERELRAALIVACEAAGDPARAAEELTKLDRAQGLLDATRVRLLVGRKASRVKPYVPVADAFLPPGVIPMNPALILPGIRTREQWGARTIRPDHVSMRPIKNITVHHSAMPPPGPFGTIAQLKQIQDIHTQDKGWADVGYHFIIDPTGQVWEGRRLVYQGAHAGGAANIGNVGICLLGDFETRPVPKAQMKGLDQLLTALRAHFSVPKSEVRTHREWKATACPGNYLHSAIMAYRSGRFATLALQ